MPVKGRPNRCLFVAGKLGLMLTFKFIVLGVRWEEGIRKELWEGEACILGPILHVVSDCGLQFLHEFWTRSS